jgi:hypothetical protein
MGSSQSVQRRATGSMVGVAFLAGAKDFPLPYSVQNGSGAHKCSYPIDTDGSFAGGSTAGT